MGGHTVPGPGTRTRILGRPADNPSAEPPGREGGRACTAGNDRSGGKTAGRTAPGPGGMAHCLRCPISPEGGERAAHAPGTCQMPRRREARAA